MINVWDDDKKRHVQMTIAESIKNLNGSSYQCSKDFMERNSKELIPALSKNGYKQSSHDGLCFEGLPTS